MSNASWRSIVIGSGLLYGGSANAAALGQLPAQAGIGFHKHFGDDSGWGMEFYGNLYTYVTPNDYPLFGGGNLQVNFHNEESPTFVYSLQGGSDLYLLKGGLELGLATQNGQRAIQYGVNIQPLIAPSYIFRSTKGLDKRYHGLGLRAEFPTLLGYGSRNQYVDGRPLRSESGIAKYPVLAFKNKESKTWLQAAFAEWASIPAFEDLVRQLAACNAPKSLVKRAKSAVDDEFRHTVLCAGIASKHLGEQVVLPQIQEDKRTTLTGMEGLVRLAVESWFDGCLNEGLAAERLKQRFKTERDADAKSALREIIPDEMKHAELAWDVLAWALETGEKRVRHALIKSSKSMPIFIQKSWEKEFYAASMQRLNTML